jgi:hypothetical protein
MHVPDLDCVQLLGGNGINLHHIPREVLQADTGVGRRVSTQQHHASVDYVLGVMACSKLTLMAGAGLW